MSLDSRSKFVAIYQHTTLIAILTDAAGRFAIYPVPAGRKCEISIRGKGYETAKKELRTPTGATGPFDIGKIQIAPKSGGNG